MGRVAKYKKIKACDPYSKKNRGQVNLNAVGVWGLGDSGRKAKKRSLKAQMMRKTKKRGRYSDGSDGFDLPPSERDDFDMSDFVVKKQKLKDPILEDEKNNKIASETFKVNGNVATIPKTDEDERKMARLLKVEKRVKEDEKKKETQASARQVGESRNAYKRRTKTETRQIIKQSKSVNEEKRQRKKEFLKKKKSKSKKGSGFQSNFENDAYQAEEQNNNDNGDALVTGERAVAAMEDYVAFGEQAERPPSFRQLPRGANKKQAKKSDPEGKSKGMTETQVQEEQGAMELLRRRVQAQYSAIKAQRRRAGDFHL